MTRSRAILLALWALALMVVGIGVSARQQRASVQAHENPAEETLSNRAAHALPGARSGPQSSSPSSISRAEAESKIKKLVFEPGRFPVWVDQVKLLALKDHENNIDRIIDEKLISAFGISGAKAKEAQRVLEEFLVAMQELEFKLALPGNPQGKDKGYFEVPKRRGEQNRLLIEHAVELVATVGDPASALALLHLVSRDYNAHGELPITYHVRERERDGVPVFYVQRIFYTSASRSAIGEGSAIVSAGSLQELPAPFGTFFQNQR